MRILPSTRRFFAPALAVFVLGVSLSSCLSTETTVTLRENGSGTVDFVYRIDREAWETGVFDDSDAARPIPVGRRDFDRAVLQIDGLRLRSHRISRGDDLVTVSARIDFAHLDALRALLGAVSLEVRLSEEDGLWRQVVAEGRGAPQAQELARSLEGYELRFELRPPRPVVSAGGQTVAGARAASFTVPLSEVAAATEPIIWEVRW